MHSSFCFAKVLTPTSLRGIHRILPRSPLSQLAELPLRSLCFGDGETRRKIASVSCTRKAPSVPTTGLPHDVGGRILDDKNDRDFEVESLNNKKDYPGDKPLLAWEHECYALFSLLASKKFFSTDQFRRTIEDLTPDQYAT
jgi:hypothetical protein